MKDGTAKDDVRVKDELKKVYCSTCGKPIGRAAPGNLSGFFCERCRNETRMDLRNAGSDLKNMVFEVVARV